jgi:hypothetical protein
VVVTERSDQAPKRFFALTAALILAIIAGACLLPHDRHLRFASLQEPAVVKAGWIYERIHDDPTPIDVVFIGSSHSVFGVDSAEIERNVRGLIGQDVHVVNFALQHFGRDVPWLLAREAIKARKVRLLVVEVPEDESRAMHPAFASLADPSDMLTAPLVVNVSYFPDLALLPLRQISLFLSTMLPGAYGAAPGFNPIQYRGAHWDDTWAEEGSTVAPIHPVRPRNTSPSAAEMERERVHWAQLTASKLSLPPTLSWLEWRANLQYVDRIAALARRHSVALCFLYLPTYRGPAQPTQVTAYEKLAPIWYPPPKLLADRALWSDINHLNYYGARALASWLATRLADERESWAQLAWPSFQ